MDYEKAYKEAIDRMKSWANGEHPECFGEAQKAAEFVFPELKKPEDEKIREELIKYLKERSHSGFNQEVRICNDGIAWLEKQGTKKPTWSEEDEIFFKTALWHISYSISNGKSTDINCDTTDWLKSLKERYTWKPSEE